MNRFICYLSAAWLLVSASGCRSSAKTVRTEVSADSSGSSVSVGYVAGVLYDSASVGRDCEIDSVVVIASYDSSGLVSSRKIKAAGVRAVRSVSAVKANRVEAVAASRESVGMQREESLEKVDKSRPAPVPGVSWWLWLVPACAVAVALYRLFRG